MSSKRLRTALSGLARRTAPLLAAGLAFFFVSPCPASADADNAGSVIAARRDAWAERGAARPPLYSKSPVFSGDRLSTNPVGRLQVLFNDDSVLMLAPDSQATITEYVYSGDSGGNAFNISLAKGVTNLISGRMVENEPGSMRVETPEITVGIQGTALAVESSGGVSKVMIAHATPGKPTIVTCGKDQRKTYLEESGLVLIMNAEAQCTPVIRRMTVDEQFFLRSLSLPLSGPGLTGAAAPVSPLTAGSFRATTLAGNTAPTLAQLDNVMQPAVSNPMTQDFAGYYAGTLDGSYQGQTLAGTFGMTVEGLTAGPTITGMSMQVSAGVSPLLWAENPASTTMSYDGSDLNAAINSNGTFAFTDSFGIYMRKGWHPAASPELSVSGGFVGGGVGFEWSVQDTAATPTLPGAMTGTGTGEKILTPVYR